MSWWGPPQPAASSAESSVSSSELSGGASGSVRNMCMPPRSGVSPRSHGPTPSHPQYRSQTRRPKWSEVSRLLDQLPRDDRDREGRGDDERLGAAGVCRVPVRTVDELEREDARLVGVDQPV